MNINQNNIYGDNNINFGPKQRKLDAGSKSQLLSTIKRGERIRLQVVMQDAEASSFAMEIMGYLNQEGREVHGPDYVMMAPPLIGQHISPDVVDGFRLVQIGHQAR